MIPHRYIVVEGPMGSGRAELARRLAAHWGVRMVEDAASNPFLPRFYRSMPHHALATQLSFLTQRADIARQMLDGDLMATPLVSDFLFEKDELFARLVLDGDELALYRRIARELLPEHPAPDLVIYLDCPVDKLLERVSARPQDGDARLPDGYLRRVHAAYADFLHQYDAAPVLIVNTEHLDLVEGDEDFELLLRCISEMRGQRSYFNKSV